jgi:hypothetical protein
MPISNAGYCSLQILAFEETILFHLTLKWELQNGMYAVERVSLVTVNLLLLTSAVLLCPLSGKWSSPAVSGVRPPPCQDFSLTMVDDSTAVLFGGVLPTDQVTNDVYTLDLKRMVST